MTAAHARTPAVVVLSHTPSPLGNLHIATFDGAVCYVGFEYKGYREQLYAWLARYLKVFDIKTERGEHATVHAQFEKYFDGRLKKFRVKTHLFGTDFQLQAWTALRAIPYGATVSYRQIAEAIGNPDASRAIGGAIGKNPISIIIPCHRVIGEDGSLTGFAGGIDRKKKLLQLEGAILV
ncbi:MAG: methylated-DNA--[protein]-cysteine S-methyltransferase [Bacteroidetes bacterium]|nr:methylated-DNA--[protein]-cysteine S-methyltransferase [Bacteroidota bacterium]